MTGKNDGLKWLAWAIPAGLSLLIAFMPVPEATLSALLIPVIIFQLLLPVITAMTGALSGIPGTAARSGRDMSARRLSHAVIESAETVYSLSAFRFPIP